jgi:SAM-dependent methyltransferase
MGRNSYWAVEEGAKSGTAIDIDRRSLDAARRNLQPKPTVEVRYESAYEIGEQNAYDIVFSIGVIHHLATPEVALRRMMQAARPGGKVLIWVYGLENNAWIMNFFDPLRRALFARMPLGLVYHLSFYPTAALSLFLKMGLSRIEYHRLLRQASFKHLRAIVFDQMIPRVANYWSRETVQSLMQGAGLEDVRLVWVNEMSWSAVGTKRQG